MDIQYVAGLFDGEGTVRIFKKVRENHIGYYVSASLAMCHRPVIEELQKKFGGTVHNNRADLTGPNRRCQFGWHTANKKAEAFLRQVTPFLIVKREEAEIALVLRDHMQQNPYIWRRGFRNNRDEILAYREHLYQRCKALKHVNYPPIEQDKEKPPSTRGRRRQSTAKGTQPLSSQDALKESVR